MRIGIVGVGFMGATHAAGWAQTEAQIAGFAGETVEDARPLAAAYGGKAYAGLEALLPDVDVVDICTPTHLHHEMVLRAAAAGKHVICEKPLALTVEQGQEMIAACRRAGVRLLVAHVVRYFTQYALAKQAVESGQVGKVGVVRLTRGSYRPKKPSGNWFLDETKSGGILLDLMIHDFDYARWIAGEVESVLAKKVSAVHPGRAGGLRAGDSPAPRRRAQPRCRSVGIPAAGIPHPAGDRRRRRAGGVRFGGDRADPQPDPVARRGRGARRGPAVQPGGGEPVHVRDQGVLPGDR